MTFFDKLGEIRSRIEKLNKKLIKRLNEKSTTKYLIDNLSKLLLNIIFKSDLSMKLKSLKYVKK